MLVEHKEVVLVFTVVQRQDRALLIEVEEGLKNLHLLGGSKASGEVTEAMAMVDMEDTKVLPIEVGQDGVWR